MSYRWYFISTVWSAHHHCRILSLLSSLNFLLPFLVQFEVWIAVFLTTKGGLFVFGLTVNWAAFNASFIEPWSSLALRLSAELGLLIIEADCTEISLAFITEKRENTFSCRPAVRSLFVFSDAGGCGSSWHVCVLFQRGVRFHGRHCLSLSLGS